MLDVQFPDESKVESGSEGSVTVQVSSKSVHKAVRNIMANELRIDADDLKREARAHAEKIVVERVDKYLAENGYDGASLQARVDRYIKNIPAREMDQMVSNALAKQVRAWLDAAGQAVVTAVIKEGIHVEVSTGMSGSRSMKVAVTHKDG